MLKPFLRQLSASLRPRARAEPSPSQLTRSLRVQRVVRDARDAVVLFLEPVDGPPLSFEAGQFLNLRVPVEGGLFRSYSLCTAPHSGELAIAVKRVPGGRASNFLNDHARAGLVLEARGPSGSFVLPPTTGPRRVLLVGGGSGITPLMSHAQHLLYSEPATQVTLVYGNRSEPDVLFRAELATLAATLPERLSVFHVLSETTAELACTPGILDEATSARLFQGLHVGAHPFDAHMLCGPEPMLNATRAALLALGVPAARIHEERFTPAPSMAARSTQGGELTARIAGETHFAGIAPGETLLDAALRARIPLDFSCTVGQCGTCMVRLSAGRVQMDEPHCLSEEEQARGMILPCVARTSERCSVERLP